MSSRQVAGWIRVKHLMAPLWGVSHENCRLQTNHRSYSTGDPKQLHGPESFGSLAPFGEARHLSTRARDSRKSKLSTLSRAACHITSTAGILIRSACVNGIQHLKTQHRAMSGITIDTIDESVKEMQYAVRGAIVTRAGQIEADLATNPSKYPFDKVVMCNIGNLQSVGQKPDHLLPSVPSLCDYPEGACPADAPPPPSAKAPPDANEPDPPRDPSMWCMRNET